MARTRRRPLPSRRLTQEHAMAFGVAAGLGGSLALYVFVNPTAAILASFNILLYAGVYTPLKQIHPVNTMVGAVVGAVPPAIGWVAATGALAPGAWVLGALLFAWQLPHFLALSWTYRKDYARGGFKMLSTVHPEKVPASSLRWSLSLLTIGPIAVYYDVTTPAFLVSSTLAGAYVCYHGYRFYWSASNEDATALFKSTLWYLPFVMLFMMIHAKRGRDDDDEDDNDDDNNDGRSNSDVVADEGDGVKLSTGGQEESHVGLAQ